MEELIMVESLDSFLEKSTRNPKGYGHLFELGIEVMDILRDEHGNTWDVLEILLDSGDGEVKYLHYPTFPYKDITVFLGGRDGTHIDILVELISSTRYKIMYKGNDFYIPVKQ